MAIKTFTTGEVLTASDTNTYLANAGLVYVTSQTVGTAVSSVTISSAFSTTFDNYKIIYTGGVGSATQPIAFQFDGGTTAYYSSSPTALYTSSTAQSFGVNNQSSWQNAGVSTADNNFLDIDVLCPFLAKFSGISGVYINPTAGGYAGVTSGYHGSATSYTGFKLIVTGTLTGGTITVYGYRKA